MSVNRTICSWVLTSGTEVGVLANRGQKGSAGVLSGMLRHHSESAKREAIMFEVLMRLGRKRSGASILFIRRTGQGCRALCLALSYLLKKNDKEKLEVILLRKRMIKG